MVFNRLLLNRLETIFQVIMSMIIAGVSQESVLGLLVFYILSHDLLLYPKERLQPTVL